MASRERESCDDHKREPAEREVRGAPPGGAQRQDTDVDEPGQKRHSLERVEPSAALLACLGMLAFSRLR